MCIVLIIAMKTRCAPRMGNMFSNKYICLKFLPAVHFEHKPAHMNGDCCQPSVRLIKLFPFHKDRCILFSLYYYAFYIFNKGIIHRGENILWKVLYCLFKEFWFRFFFCSYWSTFILKQFPNFTFSRLL